MNMRRNTILILLFLQVLSCDEPFPSYSEPQGVLQGELSAVVPDTVDVYYDARSEQYYLNSQLIFNVLVTNVHDDLLQGEALVNGTISVQSFSSTPRVILVPLLPSTLLQPPIFQGDISIPPSGTASFSTLWIPYATDGEIVFKDLPFTTIGDSKFYGPIAFSSTASVQLFERVQPINFGGVGFSLMFREIAVE